MAPRIRVIARIALPNTTTTSAKSKSLTTAGRSARGTLRGCDWVACRREVVTRLNSLATIAAKSLRFTLAKTWRIPRVSASPRWLIPEPDSDSSMSSFTIFASSTLKDFDEPRRPGTNSVQGAGYARYLPMYHNDACRSALHGSVAHRRAPTEGRDTLGHAGQRCRAAWPVTGASAGGQNGVWTRRGAAPWCGACSKTRIVSLEKGGCPWESFRRR